MKSINYVIVELDEAYVNEEKLSTGDSLIINTTIEDVNYINRVATVKTAPTSTILKQGDKVVVHHNIFRLRNNIKGGVSESNYDIGNGLYIVPLTEVFMYKRDDSDWIPISPFCFIKPIKRVEKEGFDVNASEDTHKGNVFRRGEVVHPNEELIQQGIYKGDIIVFSDYSEYEFKIDGEVLYKMSTKDVLAKV